MEEREGIQTGKESGDAGEVKGDQGALERGEDRGDHVEDFDLKRDAGDRAFRHYFCRVH